MTFATGTGTTTNTHSTTHTLSGNLDDGFTTTVAEAANTVTDETSNGVPSYSESPTSSSESTASEFPTGQLFGIDLLGYSEPPEATREDVIAEYLNRLTQLYRLEAELADTTDPAMQQYLQGEIAIQQDILSGLQQQANLTASEITDLDAQAQAAAEGNPIDLETDAQLEWWIDDALIGWKFGWNRGGAMVLNHLSLNSYLGWFDSLSGSHVNETVDGWVEDGGDAYWWANESARVGAHALHLAGGTYAWQAAGGGLYGIGFTSGGSTFMGLRVPHVVFSYGTASEVTIAHGAGLGSVWVTTAGVPATMPYWTSLTGVPILFPGAVGTWVASSPETSNCVTAGIRAWFCGMFGF